MSDHMFNCALNLHCLSKQFASENFNCRCLFMAISHTLLKICLHPHVVDVTEIHHAADCYGNFGHFPIRKLMLHSEKMQEYHQYFDFQEFWRFRILELFFIFLQFLFEESWKLPDWICCCGPTLTVGLYEIIQHTNLAFTNFLQNICKRRQQGRISVRELTDQRTPEVEPCFFSSREYCAALFQKLLNLESYTANAFTCCPSIFLFFDVFQ